MANPALQDIVSELRRFAKTAKDLASLQEFTVDLIAKRLSHYNWAPTEHVRIPVTQGICGAAVAHGETVIVEDVSSDPRYLACSIETRSEIVVPIRANGSIIGEIDIDSHELTAFGEQDRSFLEECATVIGEFLETLR
jgi:L-methionine (R)-S-oxide reductase